MRNDETMVRWFLTANMNCLSTEKQLTEHSRTQALQLSPTHCLQVYKSFDGMLYPLGWAGQSRAEQSHQTRNCSQQQQMGWMDPFPLARKKSWIFFVHLDLDCTCKAQVNSSQAYFERFCGIGFPELSWRVMSRLSLIMCWLLCYTTTP
jgi:hypothetical protein